MNYGGFFYYMKQKRKGIFISIEVIENNELDWLNKILLTEIVALTKLKNGCTASNQMLSNFLQIEKSSIHRRMKFLVENGYIETQNIFSGGKCVGRIIRHTGKLMVAQNNLMVAHTNSIVAQETTLVAEETINGSVGDQSMVAQSDPMKSVMNSKKTVINSGMNTVINSEKLQEEELKKVLKKFNLIQ